MKIGQKEFNLKFFGDLVPYCEKYNVVVALENMFGRNLNNNQWMPNVCSTGAWSLTDAQLEAVITQTGEEKSIFGLDFPFKKAPDIHAAIARIRGLNIPETAKEKILGGNLEREVG